jgi:molybdopterin-containing oxidoreductase family iron-sulfur binding subunit
LLEAWGDARAFDGTVSIQQPLIQPLYNGRSAAQILQMMTEQPDAASLAIVKGYWETQRKGADFESWWRRSVHDGVIAGSALPVKTPALKAASVAEAAPQAAAGGLEVTFRPDPGIYDGRFANLGWLQEMPKPVTKLTWDNAAVIGPRRRIV